MQRARGHRYTLSRSNEIAVPTMAPFGNPIITLSPVECSDVSQREVALTTRGHQILVSTSMHYICKSVDALPFFCDSVPAGDALCCLSSPPLATKLATKA